MRKNLIHVNFGAAFRAFNLGYPLHIFGNVIFKEFNEIKPWSDFEPLTYKKKAPQCEALMRFGGF
jgi:hypothetical protein